MQKLDSVPAKIDYLFHELAVCVNDLQGIRLQMSLEDAKQVELNVSKLEALISFIRNHKTPFRLAVI